MKDDDLLLYGGLAIGGFLLFQHLQKPKAVTTKVVPAGQTAMVTQSALPVASNTNFSSVINTLSKLLAPKGNNNPAAAQATADYNNVDNQLSDEYFSPTPINIAPANYFTPTSFVPYGSTSESLSVQPDNNYYNGGRAISPTLFTDNSTDYEFLDDV